MNADLFYRTAAGRTIFKMIQKTGLMKIGALFVRSPLSKVMIPSYIKKNGIDMTPYKGQKYRSFAEFFARKCAKVQFDAEPDHLISPCDGLLSVYPITTSLTIPMKGSNYRLIDLIPDREEVKRFRRGICLIFRLQASDYHHFMCIDDGILRGVHYIPGQLHSVQPIACEAVPVYRLNRRWWSIFDSAHFGRIAQIEVGAMLVGGVSFSKEKGLLQRGDEMGNFELAGSTIAILLDGDVRKRLKLYDRYLPSLRGKNEVRVSIGQAIGTVTSSEK